MASLSSIPRGDVEAARAFLRASPRLESYRLHMLLLLMNTSEQRAAVEASARELTQLVGEPGR